METHCWLASVNAVTRHLYPVTTGSVHMVCFMQLHVAHPPVIQPTRYRFNLNDMSTVTGKHCIHVYCHTDGIVTIKKKVT